RRKYSWRLSFLAWYSPSTWETTSWESVNIFISLEPTSLARRKPARKASYSAWLFDAGKDNDRETSIMVPASFSRMIPAPAPVELDAPSTKMVHLSALLLGSAGKIIS
ncbi:hypothetical protein A2U01_0067538, partial [Trifolium medium]|nr:hypothetical protein [Trifolium medium]